MLLSVGCGSTEASVGRATTVLLVMSDEASETSEAGRALRDRIVERDDLEPASFGRLAALAADEDAELSEDAELEAERQLVVAEEAFSNFDYSGATTALGEALDLLRPLAVRATGRRRLAQVHLELAMVLQVHGEEGAALEEIRTCVHVHPDCAPDPARHPPELLALHASLGASEVHRATVRVSTNPPGARATLDGEREATTPAEWDDVRVGRHYVTLERDGFLTEVQVINVAAGEGTTREVSLSPGPPPARASAALRAFRARGPDAEARWRREAATLTEADTLVVLRLDDALRVAAFDGRGAPLGEELRGEGDDPDGARGFLDDVLPPPSVPWYGQWWFWTPVALGVSVVLAGLTFFAVNTPDVQLLGGEVIRE